MAKNDIASWIREKVTLEVVIAFVLGVVIGLVVLGWWLWPVQWANSDPADLKASHKETYMQLLADSYALTGNVELARTRLQMLKAPGEEDTDVATALDRLSKARLAAGDTNAAMRLQALSSVIGSPGPAVPTPTVQPATTTSKLLRVFGIVFFLLLLGVGLVLLLLQLQKREARRRRPAPSARQPSTAAPGLEPEATALLAPEGPLAQFQTIYNLGDENYSDNYSIETATREFLGECGIDALEKLGIGQPEDVAAFELWLFDKEDAHTETKVLLSERAFADATVRDQLTNKGELIRAQKGQVITLETANLRLDARIVDLAYEGSSGSGVFSRLATQLAISRK